MEKNEIHFKIIQILKDLFNFENINDYNKICQDDTEDWDSIGHIRLMLSIEQEFNIKIPLEEAIQLSCVGKIVDYIQQVAPYS
jgi:acyl carrier protein